MHTMRKSLPTNMRSRRTRRDLEVDDMRNRTPSRELISKDINGLIGDASKPNESPVPVVNGSASHDVELPSPSISNGHDR